MFIAFLVIMVDMIGFGIMMPIFAFYALKLGATEATATILMGLYTAAMIVTTPILGRISDHYGRRPVLLVSMLGATAGYLLLANASSLVMIALARLISGAMAGNLAAAQAYMTDISSEEQRAKAMGMIGAAFGLGLIIGPALGGYLAGDTVADANLALPAYVSAALSSLAFLIILVALPESLDAKQREALRAKPKVNRLQEFYSVLQRPVAGRIVLVCAVYNVAAGFFEAIFPIWATHSAVNLVAGPKGLVPFLLLGGVALVIVQGVLIGPLSKRYGEHLLLKIAALGYGGGLVLMPIAVESDQPFWIYLLMALVSGFSAMILTCAQSLISQRAGQAERGMVMGVYNSAGTFGRFIGTMLTGAVFTYVAIGGPFYICGVLMIIVTLIAISVQRHWRDQEPVDANAQSAAVPCDK